MCEFIHKELSESIPKGGGEVSLPDLRAKRRRRKKR